jgi:hypothetical protein
MEGIITLPYSEYAVANKLNACFKKKEHYALFIPTSRQQKGIDLLLANLKSYKMATIQIKASRSYRLSRKISNMRMACGSAILLTNTKKVMPIIIFFSAFIPIMQKPRKLILLQKKSGRKFISVLMKKKCLIF